MGSVLVAGCIDATAMGPARIEAPTVAEVSAGDFEQGLALGARNGNIIVARLKDRTLGTEGCRALGKLEDALVKVTRTVRPSANQRAQDQDALVAGFYQGYIKEVKEGIREARHECAALKHDRGRFAGELAGSLLCNVTSISVELVQAIAIAPLYSGWAGGDEATVAECHTTATATLQSCSDVNTDLAQILSLSVEQSCADSLALARAI